MQPKVKVQGHARKPSASRTLGPDLADLSMIPVKGATIDDQVKNFIRDLLFRGPITLVNIVLCVQKRVRSSAENDASAIEKYNSDKEITPIIVELGVIVRRHYVLAKTGVDNVDQVYFFNPGARSSD